MFPRSSFLGYARISTRRFNVSSVIRSKFPRTIKQSKSVLTQWGLIGLVSISTTYCYNNSIYNDVYATDTSVHALEPVNGEETFEMGLYRASQEEEVEQFRNHRKQLIRRLGMFGIIIRATFVIEDYVIDPAITFIRFIELSLIFVPVLLVSPLCWFGSHERNTEVRSGAKLWYRYLRWSAEQGGASFIKLGQWAASRTDIFPKELCEELSKLHSNAKPHSLTATKKILSKSFGLEFDEIFDEFDDKPVGIGAIAQVHVGKLSHKALEKAENDKSQSEEKEIKDLWNQVSSTENRLTNSQKVALKVLHPNVERKINRDLKVMKFFAKVLDAIPTMEWLSLPDEVEQFSILMRLQLDLRIEARNLAKFRANFKDNLDIHFPMPYTTFTTRDVLVEEFIHGIPLAKFLSLRNNFGKNLSKEISDKGLDAFLKMLILDNFVHADLHPGNMMIRFYKNELYKQEKEHKIRKTNNEEDATKIADELLSIEHEQDWCNHLAALYNEGYHVEICFLDVGLVTELNKTDRHNFLDLFKALSEFDGYKAGELMIERSRTPDTAVNKEIFALKVEKLVDRMKERTFTLGNVSIGDLLDQVLGMVRHHHVRMEGDFITVIVAILLLEGIGRQLDPNLDLFASALPVLRKLGVSREGRDLLQDENKLNMMKVWMVIEVRQFIHASIKDIYALVRSDMLSPNM